LFLYSSNNNKPLYRSEKQIQLEHESVKTPEPDSKKADRDDFDDLIDLTHRVPKKVFKKINLIDSSNSSINNNSHSNHSNSYKLNSSQSEQKRSNLPPLPFSFVNLNDKTLPVNTSKQTSQKSHSSTTAVSAEPKQTTRIIIPVLGKKLIKPQVFES